MIPFHPSHSLAKSSLVLICSILFVVLPAATSFQEKENVVQVNLEHLLNARSVTTLTSGKLTTWTKGIDGNGAADGYLTRAASRFAGDKNPKALPDNPLFQANSQHPEILLHYSNNDSVSNQTLAITGSGSAGFDVPEKMYSKMFLALTSSEGSSHITLVLKYADGSEIKSFEVPDYYADIRPNDKDWCYLVHDLAKWGKTNQMTEPDHHNIDLLDIRPNPKRILKHIQLDKSKAGYLVLWAATGVSAQ